MEQIIQNAFMSIFKNTMGIPLIITNVGINVWNTLIKIAFGYLEETPTSFANSAPYDFINGINTFFVAVASPLTLLFFLWGFFNESVNIREEMTTFNIIKMLVRLLVANYFVVHSITLLNAFISLFTGLNSKVIDFGTNGGFVIFEQYKLSNNVEFEVTDLFAGNIFTLIFSVAIFVVLVVCGVIIIYTVYSRYLMILFKMPFSCIAFSSLSAANHEFNGMAINYIKDFLATVAELVAIVIAIRLVGFVANNTMNTLITDLINGFTVDGSISGLTDYICTMIIYCLMASLTIGMAKGASAVTSKVFS